MMSEHVVSITTEALIGWREIISALEDLVDQVPKGDIRTNHIARVQAVCDSLEAKRMEHLESQRRSNHETNS